MKANRYFPSFRAIIPIIDDHWSAGQWRIDFAIFASARLDAFVRDHTYRDHETRQRLFMGKRSLRNV